MVGVGERKRGGEVMGLISGMVMGMVLGIALVAGWSRMMRYRSTKRVAKVGIHVFPPSLPTSSFDSFFRFGCTLLISFRISMGMAW